MNTLLVARSGLELVSPTEAIMTADPPAILDIQFLVAFDSFSMIALLLLPIIILTAFFSSNATRIPTWFMVVGSMHIASIANLLLLGQQKIGPRPNVGLCLFQAMLIYAYPILASFSGLSFMLQVYLSIHLALKSGSKLSKASQRWLQIIPCAAFVAVIVEVLIVGLSDLSTVRRDPSGVYCNLSQPIPYLITASLVVISILVGLVFEVMIIIKIRRVWRASGRNAAFHPAEHVSVDVVIRVCVFTLCAIIAMMVSLIQYFPHQADKKPQLNSISVLSKSLVPFCTVFIFGTQRDMLRVWMFWRKDKPILNNRTSVAIPC